MTTVSESDQVVQRRANLEALRALGIDVYPRRFEAATTIDALIAALHEGPPAAWVEEVRIDELPPARIPTGFAVRSGAHRGD